MNLPEFENWLTIYKNINGALLNYEQWKEVLLKSKEIKSDIKAMELGNFGIAAFTGIMDLRLV